MIHITNTISLNDDEITLSFIRASGPGGQNVNKVATAAQLRFNIRLSPSLNDEVKERLCKLAGNRLTLEGEIVFKASRFRTQERNRQDAIFQLKQLIIQASIRPKRRRKTKPTYSSVQKRLSSKKLHGKKKGLRQAFDE